MDRKITFDPALQAFSSSGAHVLDLARPRRTNSGCPDGASAADANREATVFIVDDNSAVREAMRDLLHENGYQVEVFADGSSFLDCYRAGRKECVVVDVQMPGMNGIELIQRLRSSGHDIPVVVATGNATVAIAVRAMQAGATDFVEKPVRSAGLLASVKGALNQAEKAAKLSVARQSAGLVTRLTLRERQVLDLVLAGQPNKRIASHLGISQRTVEAHRAAIMSKTGSRSLSALIRTMLCSDCGQDDRSEERRLQKHRRLRNWRRHPVRFRCQQRRALAKLKSQ
jgi:two-component system CheB/CheR fusion protein